MVVWLGNVKLNMNFEDSSINYIRRLASALNNKVIDDAKKMCDILQVAWDNHQRVFICGNGGSAANALHIANDLVYGVGNCGGRNTRAGLDIEALTGNTAILTCLGNDTSYKEIFSEQLAGKGKKGDVLIVLSGSGESENVVEALKFAKNAGIRTIAVTGFNGGKCRSLADISVHVEVDDMQISEDCQLILFHMCTQWLIRTR